MSVSAWRGDTVSKSVNKAMIAAINIFGVIWKQWVVCVDGTVYASGKAGGSALAFYPHMFS